MLGIFTAAIVSTVRLILILLIIELIILVIGFIIEKIRIKITFREYLEKLSDIIIISLAAYAISFIPAVLWQLF